MSGSRQCASDRSGYDSDPATSKTLHHSDHWEWARHLGCWPCCARTLSRKWQGEGGVGLNQQPTPGNQGPAGSDQRPTTNQQRESSLTSPVAGSQSNTLVARGSCRIRQVKLGEIACTRPHKDARRAECGDLTCKGSTVALAEPRRRHRHVYIFSRGKTPAIAETARRRHSIAVSKRTGSHLVHGQTRRRSALGR